MDNTYNKASSEDDNSDEEMDDVDINYPFTLDECNQNEKFAKKDIQYNSHLNKDNNFQKIGTMMNKKIRKISVSEQTKRNSQFKAHQTQLVIENLSPFIINAELQNRFRNEPQSPTPKITENFRPFSPYNVSEFDEQERVCSRAKENNMKDTNSRILNQFNDKRKAVSPNFRPIAKELRGRNNSQLSRFKSPIPEKYLPLIMNDGIMGQNGVGTACNIANPNSRNNNKLNGFDSNGSRCDSKLKQNNFKTIDPNWDCARINKTFNQPDTEKIANYGVNKCTQNTTIQASNRKEDVKLKPNVVGKVKLKPLKEKNSKSSSKRKTETPNKKIKRKITNESSNLDIIQEEKDLYKSAFQESICSPNPSKMNKRYSSMNKIDESIHDSSFRLMDDCSDVNLYDQIHKSILKVDEDESGMAYIEGTNGRRISIFGLKSPVRKSILDKSKESDDKGTYQGSTVCSKTINKSSKKSGLTCSY